MARRRHRVRKRLHERFETPISNRIGDCVMLVLLAPLSIGSLWFLLLMPTLILVAAFELGEDARQALHMSAWVPATVLMFWVGRQHFWWSLTLTGDGIQLGPKWMGMLIPYEEVRFLRLSSFAHHGGSSWSLPLRIEIRGRRARRFMVARGEAVACLHALRHRCRQAAAVDMLSNPPRDYLPMDPDSHAQGARLLQRFWLTLGMMLAIFVGSALVVLLLALVDGASRQQLLARVEDRPFALVEGILALATLASFAWFCLRQSRKDRRRD